MRLTILLASIFLTSCAIRDQEGMLWKRDIGYWCATESESKKFFDHDFWSNFEAVDSTEDFSAGAIMMSSMLYMEGYKEISSRHLLRDVAERRTERGISLLEIKQIFKKYGMSSGGFKGKISYEYLQRQIKPALIILSDHTFAIVFRIDKERAYILRATGNVCAISKELYEDSKYHRDHIIFLVWPPKNYR